MAWRRERGALRFLDDEHAARRMGLRRRFQRNYEARLRQEAIDAPIARRRRGNRLLAVFWHLIIGSFMYFTYDLIKELWRNFNRA